MGSLIQKVDENSEFSLITLALRNYSSYGDGFSERLFVVLGFHISLLNCLPTAMTGFCDDDLAGI